MKLEKIIAQPGFKNTFSFTSTAWDYLCTKRTLYCETSDGQSLTVGAGEGFASSKDTAHFCQNIGNEEMVVLSASAGSKGKKVPTE